MKHRTARPAHPHSPIVGPPLAWGTLSAMTQPDDAPAPPPCEPAAPGGARPPLPRTGVGVDVHAHHIMPELRH